MIEIYDVITKQTIKVEDGKIMETAKELGYPYTSFSHMWGKRKMLHVGGRYILPENKNKIFTLVDLDTGQEYDCITNKTIFVHFNLPVIENEIKYIYELFRKRQHYASVCGRVFYLKENGTPTIRCPSHAKNKSEKLIEKTKQIKLKSKIYHLLLGRIHSALKAKRAQKRNRSEELLGCKIDFFIGYIEAKFTKGMTWENHSVNGWHIDHIIPCCTFDLTKEDEQKKCFHYTNLRPLWATTEIAIENGENSNYIGNLNRGW